MQMTNSLTCLPMRKLQSLQGIEEVKYKYAVQPHMLRLGYLPRRDGTTLREGDNQDQGAFER